MFHMRRDVQSAIADLVDMLKSEDEDNTVFPYAAFKTVTPVCNWHRRLASPPVIDCWR